MIEKTSTILGCEKQITLIQCLIQPESVKKSEKDVHSKLHMPGHGYLANKFHQLWPRSASSSLILWKIQSRTTSIWKIYCEEGT